MNAILAGTRKHLLLNKMKHSKRESFYWLEDAQLLDMTKDVMDDIWTCSSKQLKALWPDLSPRLLRKMRTQVNAAHLKWLESQSKKNLDILQNPAPLLNKVIPLNKLPTEEFLNEAVPLDGRKEKQREAISYALNLANPQQVVEYCHIQESRRVAMWILMNLHWRSVSIDKLDARWKQGSIIFGSPLTDLKSRTLDLAKLSGSIENRDVQQAFYDTIKNGDTSFLIKLTKALASKGKKQVGLDHISDIPFFLYANWCGFLDFEKDRNFRPPPLCFFSWKAIATYCEILLGLKENDKKVMHTNIRKYGNRLGLQRVSRPIVKEVKEVIDGICFLM